LKYFSQQEQFALEILMFSRAYHVFLSTLAEDFTLLCRQKWMSCRFVQMGFWMFISFISCN